MTAQNDSDHEEKTDESFAHTSQSPGKLANRILHPHHRTWARLKKCRQDYDFCLNPAGMATSVSDTLGVTFTTSSVIVMIVARPGVDAAGAVSAFLLPPPRMRRPIRPPSAPPRPPRLVGGACAPDDCCPCCSFACSAACSALATTSSVATSRREQRQ